MQRELSSLAPPVNIFNRGVRGCDLARHLTETLPKTLLVRTLATRQT